MPGWFALERGIAYHEAGHAAVASAQSYDVTAIDTRGAEGVVLFTPVPGEDGAVEGRRRLLSVDLAGCVAQSIADEEWDRDVAAELGAEADEMIAAGLDRSSRARAAAVGLQGDAYDVAKHLDATPPEERISQLGEARDLAYRVLVADWEDVRQIAACLADIAPNMPPRSPGLRRAIFAAEYDEKVLREIDVVGDPEKKGAALRDGDWPAYLDDFWMSLRWLGFARIHDRIKPDELYWERLRQVWEATEIPSTDLGWWREMLTADRPAREAMMAEGERQDLAPLPQEIEIYRGAGHPNFAEGLSWTLDREKAEWFARKVHGAVDTTEPVVIEGRVARSNVIAFLERELGERELLVLPDHVTITGRQPL